MSTSLGSNHQGQYGLIFFLTEIWGQWSQRLSGLGGLASASGLLSEYRLAGPPGKPPYCVPLLPRPWGQTSFLDCCLPATRPGNVCSVLFCLLLHLEEFLSVLLFSCVVSSGYERPIMTLSGSKPCGYCLTVPCSASR